MISSRSYNGTAFFLSLLVFLTAPSAFAQEKPVPTTAPFSTDGTATATNSKLMNIYDTERATDVVPLDKPHRTSEQVSTWVEENIATAMNIDPSKWDQQLKKISPQFDSTGLQEYRAYLETSGILALLQANRLRLNAIADSPSVLLSEGALSGEYHWLYQMPMMLTYYDQGTKALKRGQAKPQNQKVMIRVQVGRVASGGDDNHILIERWSAAPAQ